MSLYSLQVKELGQTVTAEPTKAVRDPHAPFPPCCTSPLRALSAFSLCDPRAQQVEYVKQVIRSRSMMMTEENEGDTNTAAPAPQRDSSSVVSIHRKDLKALKEKVAQATNKSLGRVVSIHDLIKSWVWTGTFAAKTQDMDKASSTLGDSMYVAVQSLLPTAGAGYVPRSHGGRIIKVRSSDGELLAPAEIADRWPCFMPPPHFRV